MPTLLLVVFINFVGIGALIPVLPYTVIETLGLSASVMTLLLASFAMAMFLSNPLWGGCLIILVGAGADRQPVCQCAGTSMVCLF